MEGPFPFVDLLPELKDLVRRQLKWWEAIRLGATCSDERTVWMVMFTWPEVVKQGYQVVSRVRRREVNNGVYRTPNIPDVFIHAALATMEWFRICPPSRVYQNGFHWDSPPCMQLSLWFERAEDNTVTFQVWAVDDRHCEHYNKYFPVTPPLSDPIYRSIVTKCAPTLTPPSNGGGPLPLH